MTQPTDAGTAALMARFAAEAGAGVSLGDDLTPEAELAGLSAAGTLSLHLGKIARELRLEREAKALQLARRARAVAPIWLPPVPFKSTAGVLGLDASGRASTAAEMGPQDGYVWFLTHLAVAGLVAPSGGLADAQGTVTNPGAGATIATIPAAQLTALAPAGGLYQISWLASLQGTIAAADGNNMRLTSPAGTTLETGVFPGAAGNYQQLTVTDFVPAGQAINVQAIAAASGVSAVYGAQINAQLVSGADQVSLYKVSPTLNNFLHLFTASQPDWTVGSSSVFLLPDDYLTLAGTGIDGSQIVLTGQAIQVELAVVADYLV